MNFEMKELIDEEVKDIRLLTIKVTPIIGVNIISAGNVCRDLEYKEQRPVPLFELFTEVEIYLNEEELNKLESLYKKWGIQSFNTEKFASQSWKVLFPKGQVPKELQTSPVEMGVIEHINPDICPKCGSETVRVKFSKRKDLPSFTEIYSCWGGCSHKFYVNDGKVLHNKFTEQDLL